MKIISRQLLASNACKSIQDYLNYLATQKNSERCRALLNQMADIPRAIAALGDNVTPEKIEVIVGNDNWTSVHCSGCRQKVEKVVVVGQYEDNGYPVDYGLCRSCLTEALLTLNNEGKS